MTPPRSRGRPSRLCDASHEVKYLNAVRQEAAFAAKNACDLESGDRDAAEAARLTTLASDPAYAGHLKTAGWEP